MLVRVEISNAHQEGRHTYPWCLHYKYVRLVLGKGAHQLSWLHARTAAIKKAGHTDPTAFAQVDSDLLCVANVSQILPVTI